MKKILESIESRSMLWALIGGIVTTFIMTFDFWSGAGNTLNFIIKLVVLIALLIFIHGGHTKLYSTKSGVISKKSLGLFLLPFVLIFTSMIHLNLHVDGSYVWVEEDGEIQDAEWYTFNPAFWNAPTGMIVRSNQFGYCTSTMNKGNSVTFVIEKGNFNVVISSTVSISRETWEIFDFNETDLREFLRNDIKSMVLNDFELCKLENLQGFRKKFIYEGTEMVSANLY